MSCFFLEDTVYTIRVLGTGQRGHRPLGLQTVEVYVCDGLGQYGLGQSWVLTVGSTVSVRDPLFSSN